MTGYFRDDGPLYELILDDDGQRRARPPLARVRLHHRRPDAAVHELHLVRAGRLRASCATPSSTSPAPRTRTPPPRRRSSGWPRSTWRRRGASGASDAALEAIEDHFRDHRREHPPRRAATAARPSRATSRPCRRSPSGPTAGRCRRPSATSVAAFYRDAARAGRAEPRGRRPRHGRQHADVAPLLLPRRPRRRPGDGRPAAVGLRPGQPAELLPLVEHARRGAAGPRRRRRPAPARGARRPGPADAARRPRSAAWPPSSAATGSTSAGSRSTTASTASGSRRSTTSCGGRCSRSRSGSSSTSSAATARCSTSSTASTRSSTRPWPGTTACPCPTAGRTTGCGSTTRDRYGRGGLLPMAVFLTKNSPGLRTSPVKRGYWVVRRLLGENIPPPPPNVPELPDDEAKLGDLTLRETLARHRADTSCAGCHERFDAVGLAFEGYGPVGERRDEGPRRPAGRHPRDLPRRRRGRPGSTGLRAYLATQRAGRVRRQPVPQAAGLRPRAQPASRRTTRPIDAMRARLAADGYRFGSLVESDRHQPAVPEQASRSASQAE